jgi:hypothetical protein
MSVNSSSSKGKRRCNMWGETNKNSWLGWEDLHYNKIFIIGVLWRSSQIKEETWIRKSKMKQKYPDLFRNSSVLFNFDDEISY